MLSFKYDNEVCLSAAATSRSGTGQPKVILTYG
jgi:hypothetical protein